MASAPVLADPSVMTAQERTNELVASVERDDLLAVLLVLGYCAEDEVNSRATPFGTSPLETALLYPTTRTPVRQLVTECLLQRGARADHLVDHMPSHALPAIEFILKEWDHGGRDQATTSYDLCFAMDIYAVEEFLQQHGLGPDGPHDPPSAPVAAPPAALAAPAPSSHTPSPRRRSPPQPHDPTSSTLYDSAHAEASTSSRRDGPSVGGPASRHDRRGSESAHRPSRAQSPRLEPRRRSRSPDRRDARPPSDRERRPPSPRLDLRRPERSPSPPRQQYGDSPAGPPLATRSPAREDGDVEKASSALAAPASSHWIIVGDMPMSIGERWIFETLDAHGVKPSDIHLQKSRKKPLRFAFVGFGSAPAATKAISVLDGMSVGGVKLSTSRFYDTRTRSAQPRISREDLIDRRYIGSKAQSELASFERQRGLAFLHLAPSTTEDGVRMLLCRHVPAVKVGFIDVSHGGPNPTTYADLADDESCRKAILECDGAVVDGHAIRVSWLERKNVWRPPRNAALFRSPPRRLVSISKPATPSRPDDAGTPSPSAPVRPSPPHLAQQPRSPRTTAYERDADRLRSIGLSPEQLDAVQQLWHPVERAQLASPDAQLVERSMDVKVDFGCVAKEDAALALALDGRKPAYPDDPARQARYSAFLKAQAGESKDYYTVFFAQLAEFNSVSAAFAERALATAEEARRGSGGTMDVDERVARQEERF